MVRNLYNSLSLALEGVSYTDKLSRVVSAFVFALAVLAQINRYLNIRYPPTDLARDTPIGESDDGERVTEKEVV